MPKWIQSVFFFLVFFNSQNEINSNEYRYPARYCIDLTLFISYHSAGTDYWSIKERLLIKKPIDSFALLSQIDLSVGFWRTSYFIPFYEHLYISQLVAWIFLSILFTFKSLNALKITIFIYYYCRLYDNNLCDPFVHTDGQKDRHGYLDILYMEEILLSHYTYYFM